MKDILPGAVLIEVRIGLNRDVPSITTKHYCELVFEQSNGEEIETVRDIYPIHNQQLISKVATLENIGKVIESCSKLIDDNGFFINYKFTDQSALIVYS